MTRNDFSHHEDLYFTSFPLIYVEKYKMNVSLPKQPIIKYKSLSVSSVCSNSEGTMYNECTCCCGSYKSEMWVFSYLLAILIIGLCNITKYETVFHHIVKRVEDG